MSAPAAPSVSVRVSLYSEAGLGGGNCQKPVSLTLRLPIAFATLQKICSRRTNSEAARIFVVRTAAASGAAADELSDVDMSALDESAVSLYVSRGGGFPADFEDRTARSRPCGQSSSRSPSLKKRKAAAAAAAAAGKDADEDEDYSDCMELDGSLMEGGGQVLRNAVSLSALLGCNIRIVNIRAGRSTPGLRAQHLAGIRLVNHITGGRLSHGFVKSCDIAVRPGDGHFKEQYEFEADTQTAGSVCLVMQAALPVLLFLPGPSCTTIVGGTNAAFAPFVDYAQLVLQPTLARLFAIDFELDVQKRGWFPRGGGRVQLRVSPVAAEVAPLKCFELLDRGMITGIRGVALVSGQHPQGLASEMADAATAHLRASGALDDDVPVCIEVVKPPKHESPANGCAMWLIADTSTGCMLGQSSLGERKINARKLGIECASALLEDMAGGGCVDSHMQDQLVVFMALAEGTSRLRAGPLTLHTRTAIYWAEQFGAQARVVEAQEDGAGGGDGNGDSSNVIEITGVAYTPRLGRQ